MNSVAAILGIGTAAPPGVAQEQTFHLAAQMCCQTPQQQAWLQRVFLHSGIEQRGSVLIRPGGDPLDGLRDFYPISTDTDNHGPTTAARMARYAAEAPPLAHAASAAALDHAQTKASAITHLITASCTGFFSPGLDVALIGSLHLCPSVQRLHIGFMGCHAAFNALAAARQATLADARAKVLVCCVELCSLHFAYGWDRQKLIANALFADGAAAAVVAQSADADLPRLCDAASFLLPNSLDAMTWTIGDHGFEMTLSPTVPDLIRRHLRPWCDNWLARHRMNVADLAACAIHPGGPKILDAVADALDLSPDAMEPSRKVLRCHGNMSSPTILFILRDILQNGVKSPALALGLGPGLMAEGLLF